MYMQDLSAFTYSYADTNQVFLSKTDEQGNVRQFTAVKPDDTIVLNQVESPNYGRYKVVSVNDVGAYVSIVVVFQIGEGTLLEGDTVALQAFPASAGGSGGIPEAPIDGKQYGRQDATWTEVEGGGSTPTPEALVWENVTADRVLDVTYTNDNDVPLYVQIDTLEGANGANFAFEIDGNRMGKIGTKDSQSSLFVVPSKATYRLIKMVAEGVIENWNEAKMPLAIAVGGASGGGSGTTDILPVLMSGGVNEDGSVQFGTGFTSRINPDDEFEYQSNL